MHWSVYADAPAGLAFVVRKPRRQFFSGRGTFIVYFSVLSRDPVQHKEYPYDLGGFRGAELKSWQMTDERKPEPYIY